MTAALRLRRPLDSIGTGRQSRDCVPVTLRTVNMKKKYKILNSPVRGVSAEMSKTYPGASKHSSCVFVSARRCPSLYSYI